MKNWLIGVWLLVCLGVVVARQHEGAFVLAQEKFDDAAYKLGVAEADEELNAGTATLYCYGKAHRPFEKLDRETGLPYKRIAACVMNDEIKGRRAGHDARIREYIQKRGLPSNSFKRWERELFDLRGYYQGRVKTETPCPLTRSGRAVKSPDRKYKIRLVKTKLQIDDYPVVDGVCVVVSVGSVDHEALGVLYDGDIDFFWGPKESGFAVMRVREEGETPMFMALDLKRGEWLRASE
jgi:hypothetical protein